MVPDGPEEVVVEPPGPFEPGELDVLERAPWFPPPDDPGLVEPDRRLGRGVVVGDFRLTTEGSRPASASCSV